tara:strand:+ start:601 stop:885 length:285 start_codon:yes stop_codon:yes gene_type:complete
MAEVDVEVNGRPYRIACNDGEESRVSELTKKLDTEMKMLAQRVGQLGEAQMMMLAAILLLDRADEECTNAIAALDKASESLESFEQILRGQKHK